MHVALGKVLALEDQPPIPEPLTDSAQLKHFAREAEVNDNYELATKYYQEVKLFWIFIEKKILSKRLGIEKFKGYLFFNLL